MSKTILVAGGAGFIGVNFIKFMLRENPGVKIVNFDALTYAGNLASLADCENNPDYEFFHGDIRNDKDVASAIKKYNVDSIINFAAESHVDRSIDGPHVFLDTNILGTYTLLQAARDFGIQRFLQVSTDEVYGSLGKEGMFTESTSIKPNSPYSASKASADHLVRSWHKTYDLNAVITRCSNNYGAYQFPEKMIPLCINNARHNNKIPVYGDGMQVRDWLYVYDHCTAIWAVFDRAAPGEVFNIGGNNEKTNLTLVNSILAMLGKSKGLIQFVKDRPGHDRRYAIDSSKMKEKLGWEPSVTFEQGIEKTIKWYMDNQAWLDQVTSGDYQNYYKQMYHQR
ncbi:dTDP-glucose 4,6-dehydratase [Lentisphaerota bacterium ZTH]|nr:dTDP-glucose 4,6-dehydratase [Lentisphaerota bacterium]WET07327.1 dTDP-glucose 4,6-dehydratase [Lentisphaerota bacterium ZTH]